MKILLITNWIPYPPFAGNPLRVFNLLKRIAQKHQVDLLTYVRQTDSQEAIQTLSQYCHKVYPIHIDQEESESSSLTSSFRKILFLFFPWKAYISHKMVEKLQDLVSHATYDILQIEDSFMADYVTYLPHDNKTKRILTFIDIDYIKSDRLSIISTNLKHKIKYYLRSQTMKRWEPHIAAKFDLNCFTSDVDEKIMRQHNQTLKTIVLPNGVDAKQLQPLPLNPTEKSILFVGNLNYLPNEDGVLYFTREIFPRIADQIPQLNFFIIGNNPSQKVLALQNDCIHVMGLVPDLLPYYQRCSACVIPLRAGGGTRLKILEAMAYGRPIVSTSIGCEGIAVEDGKHILIADDPQSFADRTVALLSDNQLQQKLIQNARRLIEQTYDWDIIAQRAVAAYEKLR